MEITSRFGKTEKIIFAVASICLAIFSFFLYDDSLLFPKEGNSKLENIGSVAISQNDVRRKNLDNFSWLPASTKDSIYQNDSLFTGDRSEATISLNDGTQIKIEPNSLITLNLKSGQMHLDLRYGNLVGEIAKNSALIIKSGTEEFKLEGTQQKNEKSQVRFKKSHSGTVGMKLISGNVRLVSKKENKPTELVKNMVTSVSAVGEVKKVEIKAINLALTPSPETEVLRANYADPIPFEWNASGEVARYEFELSKAADYSDIKVNKNLKDNKFQLIDSVADGRYFWRVIAYDQLDQVLATSSSGKISIRNLPTPVILSPVNQSLISKEVETNHKDPLSIIEKVSWQAAPEFKLFKYQISRDSQFASVIQEDTTINGGIFTPNLYDGEYWVRVAAQTAMKKSSEWSKAVSFKVKLIAKLDVAPAKPVLYSYKINFSAPAVRPRNIASAVGPKIEWKPIPEAAKYKIQFSKDKSFTNPEVIETDKPRETWFNYKNGTSYFRVIAMSKTGKLSEPSKMGLIQVLNNGPQLAAIPPIELIGDTFLEKQVALSWSAIEGASGYFVEVDSDSSFSNPVSYKFKTNNGPITIAKAGEFKVHVQALNEKDIPITIFSNVQKIVYNYKLALKTPTPLEPYNNASIFLQKLDEPSIWVEWKKVKGASVYKFEISDKEDFAKTTVSTIIKDNHFLINQKLKVGKFFWRVRAQTEDEKFVSEWSKPQGIIIYNQKNEGFQ